MELDYGKASRQGGRSSENQDYAASSNELFAVFDGTGPAGARAARAASSAVEEAWAEARAAEPAAAKATLRGGLEEAHRRVRALERGPNGARSASSALVAAPVSSGVVIAHVGDCRAYLLRAEDGASVEQLTRDHDLAWYRESRGERLGPDEKGTKLAYTVGGGLDPVPELCSVDLRSGDVLLLASDGLWAPFEARLWVMEAVMRTAGNGQSPSEAAASLVSLSIELGSDDDSTALLLVARRDRGPRTKSLAWFVAERETKVHSIENSARLRAAPGRPVGFESPPASLIPADGDVDVELRSDGAWELRVMGRPAEPSRSALDSVRVNGAEVRRACIVDGDRVEIAGTEYVFKTMRWVEPPP